MSAGLTVRGLVKSFGSTPVLRGVELDLPRGATGALLGASGSGKTTLLRTIAGFEIPEAGEVAIGGRVVEARGVRVPPERRRVGYVPQDGALFPHLDVARNVGFALPRERRREVGGLLELVGLQGFADRYPHQLSGGQQQRVALARALAVEPEIVLLDEPFSALDPQMRAAVRDDVRAVLDETGTTALLVTHDQDEALSIADTVAVLRAGVVAQCAAPRALYGAPVDASVAAFLGEANLLEGVVRDGRVDTPLGILAARGADGRVPPAGPVVVLVRPEQVELAREPESANGATVESVSYHGHDALVRVRHDAGVLVLVRTLGDPGVADGARCALHVRGEALVWPAGATTL